MTSQVCFRSIQLLGDFSGLFLVHRATGGLLRFASGLPGYWRTCQLRFRSNRLHEDFLGLLQVHQATGGLVRSLQVHQATGGLLRLTSGLPGYWRTSLLHRKWTLWSALNLEVQSLQIFQLSSNIKHLHML